MIFVVDSSTPSDEFDDARSSLHEVLSNITLRRLPCLILANYQDKPDARTEQQVSVEGKLETKLSLITGVSVNYGTFGR